MMKIKEQFVDHIHSLQNRICEALELEDGKARFISDRWERLGGGGGESRVIRGGVVFEKGGVNTSVVHGKLPSQTAQELKMDGDSFFAAGLSLVLHPGNPFAPTVHANWRYFELYDAKGAIRDAWFGGGTDLTPYYLIEEDIVHFHSVQKTCCDVFDKTLYRRLKEQCDYYFRNHHRNDERRGVGGIFFDHCRGDVNNPIQFWQNLTEANGAAFLDGYLPIVKKRKHTAFTPAQKYWQELRRGRYVEFNLLHDRGTMFGIETKGRTESILMSLPPTARFDYDFIPEPGSEEEKLVKVLQQPQGWIKT